MGVGTLVGELRSVLGTKLGESLPVNDDGPVQVLAGLSASVWGGATRQMQERTRPSVVCRSWEVLVRVANSYCTETLYLVMSVKNPATAQTSSWEMVAEARATSYWGTCDFLCRIHH